MKRSLLILLFFVLIISITQLGAIEKVKKGPYVFNTRLCGIKFWGDGPGSKIKSWGGFGWGYNISQRFSLVLDGEVGWTRPWGEKDQRFITYVIPVNLNGRFYILDKRINPFITAGVGMLYWDLRNVTWDDSEHTIFKRFGYSVYNAMQRDLMFNAGLGVQFRISKSLNFDLYSRYHHIYEQGMDMSGLDEYYDGIIEAGIAFTVNFNFNTIKDSDGDGILDNVDADPEHPEDFDGYQDEDGAPDPDNDGDGIPDIKDKAPNKAEDKDGYQDDDGVPDLDNDGDGIPDVKDICPNKPEYFNGYQDDDGCPDVKPAPKVVETKPAPKKHEFKAPEPNKPNIYRLKYITFEFNSFKLTDKAKEELDKFAATIKEYPNAELKVNGYTDNIGSKSYNIMLSKKRANAVREYLIIKGIPAYKIKTEGFGPANPIASNKTKEGRAKNRRIEIEVNLK